MWSAGLEAGGLGIFVACCRSAPCGNMSVSRRMDMDATLHVTGRRATMRQAAGHLPDTMRIVLFHTMPGLRILTGRLQHCGIRHVDA